MSQNSSDPGSTQAIGLILFAAATALAINFAAPDSLAEAPIASPNPVQRPNLVFAQGEQRLIRVPGLKKYSLGASILRVLELPFRDRAKPNAHPSRSSEKLGDPPTETLLLKAILPGITDLWVWKEDGSIEIRNIRILPSPARQLSPRQATRSRKGSAPVPPQTELESALEKLEETEVIFTGNGVVLRGEIQSQSEAFRISNLSYRFQKEIRDETLPSPKLLKLLRLKLETWVKRTLQSPHLRNSSLRLEEIGQTLWLKGSVPTLREQQKLEKEARSQSPYLEVDLESLPDAARTVHFKVFLLEVKQNHFSSLGISWPTQIEALLAGTAGSEQVTGNQLKWILNQMEGKGQGRILSQPELVVRTPGEAELFAGGEIPIQLQSRFYSNVNWRNYGLTLRLKVTHATGRKIRMEIFIEVSHLDRVVSQEGIPGVQSNRLKTEVDAQFGHPLFLSGLFQQTIRKEVKGFPFLQNIPVLGALFRSEDFLNERSELVAILYPTDSPPSPSLKTQRRFLPKGPLPAPRNWLDPEQEHQLRQSQEFPWNAFQ